MKIFISAFLLTMTPAAFADTQTKVDVYSCTVQNNVTPPVRNYAEAQVLVTDDNRSLINAKIKYLEYLIREAGVRNVEGSLVLREETQLNLHLKLPINFSDISCTKIGRVAD